MTVPDWMIDTPSPNVDDMAAVIRQLVHSLRKAAPDNEVATRAMAYLKKHGLEGSPLRATPTDGAGGDVASIPADVIDVARRMKANGYRGSLVWARKVIDWVAEQSAAPSVAKDGAA